MTAIADIIMADPTVVTITRRVKVQNAGGFSWSEVKLDPLLVRLYNISPRNQREVTLPEGEVKEVVLGLLADGAADIVVGHDSYDTFEVYSDDSPPTARTFRIVGVRHYRDANLPIHTQADCVAV